MTTHTRPCRPRPSAVVDRAPVRTVRIGDPDNEGAVLRLKLRWLCPVPECRRPRGEPVLHQVTYRDANGKPRATARVHQWTVDCGHVRLTRELLAEAADLAGHQQQSTNVPVPRSPNG